MERVAVLGASGFVGTTVVEHLLASGRYHVCPFIHSGKNAWRLARLGLDLQRANLLDEQEMYRVLDGCDYVINSVMGPRNVMLDGLQNLLAASTAVGVKRFVHFSSITAYGEPPPPQSVQEDAPARPQRGTYGWIKMTQDKLVYEAAEQGLSCAVLCPPVVSGPRSTQLMWLLKGINEGRFALVNEGESPCAVVDVDNLAHATLLALKAPQTDGKRIFILDDKVPTWRELIEAMKPLVEGAPPIPSLSRAQAAQLINVKPKLSPMRTLKHLASPQVRRMLGQDPLIRTVAKTIKRVLPETAIQSVRNKGNKAPAGVRAPSPPPKLDTLQLARQLRGVYHSGARAERVLGYTPVLSFAESMHRFREWYMSEKGWTSSHADLIAYLDPS